MQHKDAVFGNTLRAGESTNKDIKMVVCPSIEKYSRLGRNPNLNMALPHPTPATEGIFSSHLVCPLSAAKDDQQGNSGEILSGLQQQESVGAHHFGLATGP